MRLLQRILALLCLVVLFIFCVSNSAPVTVRFLAWESLELPIFLLLIFAFLTGGVLALLGQSLRNVTRSTTIKAKKKKISEAEQLATTDRSDVNSEINGPDPENEGDK